MKVGAPSGTTTGGTSISTSTSISGGDLYSFKFAKPYRTANVGIILQNNKDGDVCVTGIYETAPAATSGLQVGDIIQEINNVSMKGRKASVATFVLKNAPKGEVIVLATSFHKQQRGGLTLSLSFQINKPLSKKAVVGISLRNHDVDGNIFVTKVKEGGLAADSGIAVNDIIQEINGISMVKKDSSVATDAIKEAIGNITVLVARPTQQGTRVDPNILSIPAFEEAPPPGVEGGGIWGIVDYFGPMTIFMACFLCFAIFIGGISCDCSNDGGRGCKEDSKKAYMIDGMVYNKSGKSIGVIDSVDFRLAEV